jgi:hypothetical protein
MWSAAGERREGYDRLPSRTGHVERLRRRATRHRWGNAECIGLRAILEARSARAAAEKTKC